MQNKSKILKKVKITDGKFISLERVTVCIDNKEYEWDYVTHPGAVAVALYNKKTDKYIMVNQYRVVPDDMCLEFCAGKIDKGEDIETTLKREVIEETGYSIKNIKYYGFIYPSVAFLEEKIYLYRAEIDEFISTNLDIDEKIDVVEYSIDEIKELINKNKIYDAKSIALSYYLINDK